jgi:putative transposase
VPVVPSLGRHRTLDMPMKKHKPEQIVALLRQIEIEIANGKSTPQACKEGSRDHGSNVLPLEKRVRRPEVGSSETDEGARAREREAEAFSRGAVVGEADPEGRGLGKLLSPERRRRAVEHAREKYEVSERHARQGDLYRSTEAQCQGFKRSMAGRRSIRRAKAAD